MLVVRFGVTVVAFIWLVSTQGSSSLRQALIVNVDYLPEVAEVWRDPHLFDTLHHLGPHSITDIVGRALIRGHVLLVYLGKKCTQPIPECHLVCSSCYCAFVLKSLVSLFPKLGDCQ